MTGIAIMCAIGVETGEPAHLRRASRPQPDPSHQALHWCEGFVFGMEANLAGDWIKMRCDLHTHPKVVRISSACQADILRTVGGLHAVWCLFDVHSTDGHIEGFSLETLDNSIRFPGFACAMTAVGWLEVSDTGITCPRFDEHNSKSAKRRATDSEAKRRVRKVSAKCPQNVRKHADEMRTREEKRREEKSNKNTPTPFSEVSTETALPGAAPSEPWVDGKAESKSAKKAKRPQPDPIMIPDNLAAHPGFAEAWAKWEAYRREGRKTMTASTRNLQLGMLAKHGPTKAIEMMERSRMNGWTGLFEDSGPSVKVKSRHDTRPDCVTNAEAYTPAPCMTDEEAGVAF